MDFEEFSNAIVACPNEDCTERDECLHGRPHIRESLRYVNGDVDTCKEAFNSWERICCPACVVYKIEFISKEEMEI